MKIQSTKLPPAARPAINGIKAVGLTATQNVHAASTKVDQSPALGHALSAAGAAVRSTKAFPKLMYPTIYGATGAEKASIIHTLDSLPLHQVSGVRSIRMVPEIPSDKPGWVIHGRAWDMSVSNRIELSRATRTTPEQIRSTLTHEVGHTVDYESQKFFSWRDRSNREPFGEEPYITDYAETNHREDFAESYEEYHLDPENLKDKAPEKYKAIEELDKPSLMERLIDREEFRETGKYMSEAFDGSEVARHVGSGAYIASSLLQGVHGVSQWARSASTGDSLGHASGVLNTASGIAFASGISPLVGMSLQGANQALQSAAARGDLSAEEIESTVTLPVRPIDALFGHQGAKIESEHRPAKVLAVAAGGAVGGTAGSLVGPYLGVLGGYHLAQSVGLAGGLGGAVGLVAGGMIGFMAGAEIGGRVAGKIVGVKNKPVEPRRLKPRKD